MYRWLVLITTFCFADVFGGQKGLLGEHYAEPIAVTHGGSSLKDAKKLQQVAGEKIKNYFVGDLNGDGADDYVVAGNHSSWSADFAVIDGRDSRLVAKFSGFQLFKVPVKVNGWPTLLNLRRDGESPKSPMLGTLVFDGKEYVTASLVHITEQSLVRILPKGPPKP